VSWLRRWRKIGSAKEGKVERREYVSIGEKAPVAKQADLTLDEPVAAMHKRGIPGSRTASLAIFRAIYNRGFP
jgi:hypothetical protein